MTNTQPTHTASETTAPGAAASPAPVSNFIRDIVENDLKTGKHQSIVTRFPPEPNGYLHIGHAKSICLNFGVAREFGGVCHLRMDDTNPMKEDQEYVDSIIESVRWLGFDWQGKLFFASDYYERLYEWAVELIRKGLAFVCELTPDQIREHRGTLTKPGRESPFRNRSADENLDLFERMRKGEFPEGSRTLRAKIDMNSPNINMRDPVVYRIMKATHHRCGDKWIIYPMYDFAHPLSDALEGITHSICTLEFEDHRPLYDWFINNCTVPVKPRQIEFARLNLTYTMMSKRKLLELVEQKIVNGWDDPRMPTISGLRRRGYTPEAIRDFCERIGVAKANSTVDFALLEHCIREDMNKRAPRAMAVLKPLKVIVTNYPEGKVEELEAINNPEDPTAGTRKIPFSRELYIEQDDFREEPPKGFYRLSPGKEVRLKFAYYITCQKIVKDENGQVIEVHCTYDPETRGGTSADKRKVKGTSHWVSASHAKKVTVRLYETLFAMPNPSDAEQDYKTALNPKSLEVVTDALVEPMLGEAPLEYRCQFERTGYFFVDPKDSRPGAPIFNRIVSLKDAWTKIENKAKTG